MTAAQEPGRPGPGWSRRDATARPRPWLFEGDHRAVRHLALRQLLDLPEGNQAVRRMQSGKTWAEFEKRRGPSKWVTLRACSVLKEAADG